MILGPSGVLLAQPRDYAEIDWSNPDTQGLVGFYIIGPTTTFDLVTRVERNVAGLTNVQKLHVVGRSGYSMNGVASTTANENWPSPLPANLTPGVTVLARGRAFSTPGANQNLVSLASATITANALFLCSPASGALGRVRLLIVNDGGTTRLDITSTAEIFTGNTDAHTIVGTFTHPTNPQGAIFADGGQIASGSGTGGGPFTFDNISLNSLRRATVTRGWRGELYLGAVWNRSLPPDAAARVSANPWALLRHSPRRVWVDFGAGGGTDTPVTPGDLLGNHTISQPSIATGLQLSGNSLASEHSLSQPSLASGLNAGPDSLAHAHAIGSPQLSTLVVATVADISQAHELSVPSVIAGLSLTPTAAASSHELSSPLLSTLVTATPADVTHGVTLAVPSLSRIWGISPATLLHENLQGATDATTSLSVNPAAVASSHSLSSPGVTMVIPSNLYQTTAANKPLLDTVPGEAAALAGFNSWLFADGTDFLECEMNTASGLVYYAWLDDGTELTVPLSASAGILRINAPAGRKMLLAAAHPSAISSTALDRLRALATYLRGA